VLPRGRIRPDGSHSGSFVEDVPCVRMCALTPTSFFERALHVMNALTKGFTGAQNHTSGCDHHASGAPIGVSFRNHCLAIVVFIGFITLYFACLLGSGTVVFFVRFEVINLVEGWMPMAGAPG